MHPEKHQYRCNEHGIFTSGQQADTIPCPICGAAIPRHGTEASPKQGNRSIVTTCLTCGYITRTTRKWLDTKGAPICPCNMEAMALRAGEPGEAQDAE